MRWSQRDEFRAQNFERSMRKANTKMKTEVDIIGAGLAGLLAANMLRHRSPNIYELQRSLPNNHSAVLRFRTSAIGDVLNIPFREVTMIKTHIPWRNPVADALAYSFKNNKTYRSDRSITDGLTTAKRWIAPRDLIQRMANQVDKIDFDYDFTVKPPAGDTIPVISTIPMPALMKKLGYPERIPFYFQAGLNVRAHIANCDAYVSLLVPDPNIPFSRISITGDELIIECMGDRPGAPKIEVRSVDRPEPYYIEGEAPDQSVFAKMCVDAAATMLGIHYSQFSDIVAIPQKYAKISPIDDRARKDFLFWATDKFNIFSLGRFATWRPHLLLDDLIQDIRLIDRWIGSGRYAMARHR